MIKTTARKKYEKTIKELKSKLEKVQQEIAVAKKLLKTINQEFKNITPENNVSKEEIIELEKELKKADYEKIEVTRILDEFKEKNKKIETLFNLIKTYDSKLEQFIKSKK